MRGGINPNKRKLCVNPMIMTREKKFYTSFFALFWPLVLQNIINLGVNLADNIMLGAYSQPYSQPALSGATAVNQLQFILQCLTGGVGGGLTVLGSQYWGQKRLEPIKKLTSVAFWVSVMFSMLLFGFCAVTPGGMVKLFINTPEVVTEGVSYLNILKYSYPIFAIYSALLFSLNCVETVRIAFWVSVQTLVVNVGLNIFMIPAYGAAGAAWATLAARIVSLAIVVLYVALKDKKLQLKIRDLLTFDRVLFLDFVKVALPVIAVSGMWGFSNAIQTSILGHMPDAEAIVAANSAAQTLYQLFKSAAQGAASAAGIIMAKTVGAGDLGKVKEYSRTMQAMFIIIGLITAALLLSTKDLVISLYTLPESTKELANSLMLILSVCAVGMSYQMPTCTGIIRGGGDTKFCMYNDIVSIWCIVLPVSWLAAYVFKWPPVVVVACLNADQVFKCLAISIRCNRYKWVKKLTRDEHKPTAA